MKAILVTSFGGPEVLQLTDVPDPSPAEGQVLVRVHAAGVNPVDAYIRSGPYARTPPLPYIPGFDGAGVVDAIGEGVTTWRPGDRVWIGALGQWRGTYAERLVCDPGRFSPLPAQFPSGAGPPPGVPAPTPTAGS